MAEVEIIKAPPVPQPPDKVVLTLSREEAEVVAGIIGAAAVSPVHPAYQVFVALWEAGVNCNRHAPVSTETGKRILYNVKEYS